MRSFTKKVALVVDGFSTGRYITHALKNRGHECIHILSDPNHPKRKQIDTNHYVETIIYNSMEEVISKLKVRQILFCVPGDESGVILADQINEALKLSTSNGTEYSFAKRNKFLMNEVAKKAGLSVVRHFKSQKLEDIVEWIKTIGTWPVVIKPLDSASGDGVYICKNFDEVSVNFKKILSCRNKFGIQNQEVLAEEFNPGTEYIVNTVSCGGKHHIVEIWKMNKLPGTIIHDTCEFIYRVADSSLFSNIEQYCFKLLDAFTMKFGACTIELKCLENQEPILIEIGARLMGDAELSLTNDILGYNQLSLMIDAYLSPSAFVTATNYRPLVTPHCLAVLLISSSQGKIVRELAIVQYLMSLAALHSFHLPIVGDEIAITKDIATCPGIIYLKDNDKKAIEKAYNEIRDYEHNGLYSNAIETTRSENQFNRSSSDFTLFSEIKNLESVKLLDQSNDNQQKNLK